MLNPPPPPPPRPRPLLGKIKISLSLSEKTEEWNLGCFFRSTRSIPSDRDAQNFSSFPLAFFSLIHSFRRKTKKKVSAGPSLAHFWCELVPNLAHVLAFLCVARQESCQHRVVILYHNSDLSLFFWPTFVDQTLHFSPPLLPSFFFLSPKFNHFFWEKSLILTNPPVSG